MVSGKLLADDLSQIKLTAVIMRPPIACADGIRMNVGCYC